MTSPSASNTIIHGSMAGMLPQRVAQMPNNRLLLTNAQPSAARRAVVGSNRC
jgi:hypothetical protein